MCSGSLIIEVEAVVLESSGVPSSELKRGKGATHELKGQDTRQSCELHAFTAISQQFEVAVRSFFSLLNKIQQESPGCPTVTSLNHAVCLAAEHTERWRSPRSHEIADADAEAADPFYPQQNNIFLA